jgi:regulatory protein
MPTITSVEKQKKNPRRFNVFLNGEFGFGADEDTIVNFRLLKGKIIEPQDLEKILFETEIGKVMDKMYRLFGLRQRSEKEVRDYFRIKNVQAKIRDNEPISDTIIELVIERLKQKGLLNDKEFARSWLEARRKSQKKGLQIIKSELFQKGIDREIIAELFEEVSLGQDTEGSIAKQSLEKKARIWKNLDPNEFRKKATEFLVRRGFSYSIAKETVDNFLNPD